MTKKTDEALLRLVSKQLDNAVDEINMAARSRLNIARNKALQEIRHPPFFSNAWLQSAVLASALVCTWLLWSTVNPTSSPEAIQTNIYAIDANDMDVLMSNEEIDFLENLEVYEWLEAEYG